MKVGEDGRTDGVSLVSRRLCLRAQSQSTMSTTRSVPEADDDAGTRLDVETAASAADRRNNEEIMKAKMAFM